MMKRMDDSPVPGSVKNHPGALPAGTQTGRAKDQSCHQHWKQGQLLQCTQGTGGYGPAGDASQWKPWIPGTRKRAARTLGTGSVAREICEEQARQGLKIAGFYI